MVPPHPPPPPPPLPLPRYVGLPDAPARAAIVRAQLARVPHDPALDPAALAAACEGYSGAEMVAVFREAALCAIQSAAAGESPTLTAPHVLAAIEAVPRQVTREMLDFFDAFQR